MIISPIDHLSSSISSETADAHKKRIKSIFMNTLISTMSEEPPLPGEKAALVDCVGAVIKEILEAKESLIRTLGNLFLINMATAYEKMRKKYSQELLDGFLKENHWQICQYAFFQLAAEASLDDERNALTTKHETISLKDLEEPIRGQLTALLNLVHICDETLLCKCLFSSEKPTTGSLKSTLELLSTTAQPFYEKVTSIFEREYKRHQWDIILATGL